MARGPKIVACEGDLYVGPAIASYALEPTIHDEPLHPFNPEEVDIGVGIQRGEICLDCGETELEGPHL